MINARRCLFGSVREFIDRELCGVVSWDHVIASDPEPAPPLANGRRNPIGKYREKVAVNFDRFRIEVCSPEEEPPLGRVDLFMDDQQQAGGPLDVQVWARLGKIVREMKNGA